MRTLKISLLVFILSSTISAQEGWFFQNPLPQNNDLYDVQIVEPNIIYAVGKGGTVIKSTDTGESWEIQNTNTNEFLWSVFFLNSSKGWAVGNRGTILHTVNGGLNWMIQESNVINDLKDVFFINDTIGFIVGVFKVLKTTDGGSHWYEISELSNYDNLFETICFANDNIGWLAGSMRKVVRTTDRGQTWEFIYQGNNGSFNSLFFADLLNGWGAGYGYIGKTTDGGYSWQYPINWNGIEYKKYCLLIHLLDLR